ncbi:MAG TPA: hypothetical protein VMZ50_13415, partial [Phycisphaerae bacterium]|nr:hypothetical protein [Phycisphaerae bacterium]
MRTPGSDRVSGWLGGALDKGGTSGGAKRGWETRRGRAAVEPERGEGRSRRAEEDVEPSRVLSVEDIPDEVKALAAKIG